MSIALDRLATLVRQLQGALGGKTRVSGQATATWAAGAAAAGTVTVTHGLGATPEYVAAHSISTGGPYNVLVQPINVGATTFQLVAAFSNGATWAAGGSHTIAWEAWG